MSVPGSYVALDVGQARIGVARSCADAFVALAVKTLVVQPDGSELDELVDMIADFEASAVFVGLPRLLSGREGAAARMARSYAKRLAKRLDSVEVRLVDERLTSVSSHRKLRTAGVATKRHKEMVDQVADCEILDQVLQILSTASASSQEMPGELVMI